MPETEPSRSIWRKDVLAWCCYDWANSGYTTLMITVFVVYMQRTVFTGNIGAVVWAWSVAISMLVGAILSPVMGALADAQGAKRTGLLVSVMMGSLACMAMAIIPPELPWLITACFVFANLGLELSLTFYNGFLPEIAREEEMNRVSSAGMGWGYLGGGIALVLAMLILTFGERWGIGRGTELIRICIFLTGLWWLVFSIPTIVVLRDRPRRKVSTGLVRASRSAMGDVIETLSRLRQHRTLAWFLIAFLFFNDGLQTVISQASTFAIQELKFSDQELVALILMVQFVATPGAVIVGVLADRWGRQPALVGCLVAWILLLGSAWFIQTKSAYWVMAVGVALVLGGTQAISRAIMGVLTPRGQEARYFGFFNLSGKATSFMGTFFFGLIVILTGSSRLAIVNLVVFFAIGLLIILNIDLRRGTREREEAERFPLTVESSGDAD